MAEGPIPWIAIVQWCDVYGITGTQAEDLLYFVRGLDNTYMEWHAKRREKSNPVGKPKRSR